MMRGNFGDFKDEQRSIGDEFDDEFEDETFTERLVGLTEMFPEPVKNFIGSAGYYGYYGSKKLFSISSALLWGVSTALLVAVFPIILENERLNAEQSQLQQQRQILLGPHATIASHGVPPHHV